MDQYKFSPEHCKMIVDAGIPRNFFLLKMQLTSILILLSKLASLIVQEKMNVSAPICKNSHLLIATLNFHQPSRLL